MRDVVFVVGMGRSGTSALTRVLGLCGGALPIQPLEANYGNPSGYWEPETVVELNDAFLEGFASSWYDVSLRLQSLDLNGEAEAFVDRAAEMLASSFEPRGPLIVKDPRISGLLPYWTAAAARNGLRSTAVHIFRHPAEVAASLKQRDDLPREQSDALWLKYNLIAERDTREFPRIVVSFDDLMENWESVVARCVVELGVALTVDDGIRIEVSAFLSDGLRHHAVANEPDPDAGGGIVLPTYRLLHDAKRGVLDAARFDEMLARHMAAPHAAVGI